jgi:excisionase family DNA binding protein
MAGEPYPETLTIAEFAELVDVGKSTVSQWITQGLITVKRGPGRRVAIPSAGVTEFLPPAGDSLMAQHRVRELAQMDRGQVSYQRTQGFLWPVKTPGGHNRYLRSEVAAMIRRRPRHRKGRPQ